MNRITERSRSGALEAFLKGQKVLMLTEFDDGDLVIEKLEELLPEDSRYLVDAVPAVENPKFKQAIEEMVEQKTEELADERQAKAIRDANRYRDGYVQGVEDLLRIIRRGGE